MLTNLIKHVIAETVTRLLTLITPADVLEAVSESSQAHDALVAAAQKFVTRTSVAAIAAEIDLADLAREVDMSDLASNLEIDYADFSRHVEIDHAALAAEIEVDYERLADLCGKGLGTPEGDRALEDRINEAVGHAISNAVEIVRRADAEAKAAEATVAETVPDLSARLLAAAVDRLLALADEAVKNGLL